MTKPRWTYRRAGVTLQKAGPFLDALKKAGRATPQRGVVAGIGGFSGLFDPARFGIARPLLVASADGVGTKLKLAQALGKVDTVGQDLVAMCVNDVLTCGARPVFFLDYYATGHFARQRSAEILKGISKGCRLAGCALLGGETAEMPGLYRNGDFDLAGFSVGLVDRSKILTGREVKAGDLVVGLASSGPHSNGYALIRKLVRKKHLRRWAAALLAPTRIYVKPVLELLDRVRVHALAHITGGGFYENIPRALPHGLGVWIDRRSWSVPPVFSFLEEAGRLPLSEMFRVFNMGIGMVAVTARSDASHATRLLERRGVAACVIGEVVRGEGVLIP